MTTKSERRKILMSEPVIGITCSHRKNSPDQYMLAGAYCRSVEKAGGIPVLLPVVKVLLSPAKFERPLGSFCQGLLLSGGGDFDPSLFGELPHPHLGSVDLLRDHWEITLIHKAQTEGLPLLGICRGMQAINIALGGSLYQDLPSQYPPGASLIEHRPSSPGEQVGHRVSIKEDTNLHSFLERTEIWTNSHHHQAIKDLAPGLKISARSDDQVIEGIEGTGEHLLLGVQWHPERQNGADSQKLFAGFIRACREKATGKKN